jgi:hypothetical protein
MSTEKSPPPDAPHHTTTPPQPQNRVSEPLTDSRPGLWRDSDLIGTAEIARRLQKWGASVDRRTPQTWWRRTRQGRIEVPMPNPIVHATAGRYPLWRWGDITRWYAEFKDEFTIQTGN